MKPLVAICHAAWMPGRAETLERLMAQLDGCDVRVFTSLEREHSAIWARRAWRWGAAQDRSVCYLNDDVTVCPRFAEALTALIDENPEDVISLHTQTPAALQAAEKGYHLARSRWLTGPAYVLPPGVVRELLDRWQRLSTREALGLNVDGVWGTNEDSYANRWAWRGNHDFLTTIPAIALHDVETPSSLGYEHHHCRGPSVPFLAFPHADVTSRVYWRRPGWLPYAAAPWESGEVQDSSRAETLRAPRYVPPVAALAPGQAPTIALGVPHASWVPERAAAMAALRPLLAGADHYREGTERGHWSVWFLVMLRWAAETGASHFLTTQDDVELAPEFWPILRAIVTAWPDEVISLAATHSLAPEVARTGRRSYRTPKVLGWGWLAPMPIVGRFLEWADEATVQGFQREQPNDGEDTLFMRFLETRGIVPRSPVPTILDHLHGPSVYGNEGHEHRRSVVRWTGYELADLRDPRWWQTGCADLPSDVWRRCWWCGKREERFRSTVTGASICGVCLATLVAVPLGVGLKTETA